MNRGVRLNMLLKDRVGIVADISTVLAEEGLNINSMEVERKSDTADVYFEAAHGQGFLETDPLLERLSRIDGLISLKVIHTLPQEARENRLRVILDNISEGVIAIDTAGTVTTINKNALDMLGQTAASVAGLPVSALDLPDHMILKCLKGESFSNLKKEMAASGGRYRYFATGRPITDGSGRITGAVEIAKDMREIKMLAQAISQPDVISFSDIIGTAPAVAQAIGFARKIAATDSVISIRGDSGTGKDLFARAIHFAGPRKGPFVPINCAALPEALLESELFGYEGGAFTGAKKQGKAGLFEIAHKGTLFLDEIAEMPGGCQAKILRAIQDKVIRRVGGDKEIPVNARIITATNRNLENMVTAKAFRPDLYYRINVLPIHIPPLQERIEDIPALVEHFLFQLSSKLGKTVPSLSRGAMDKLLRHSWPGNIRELKNVIERGAILCDGDRIQEHCILFSDEIGFTASARPENPDQPSGESLKILVGRYEKQIIREMLKKTDSLRQAARFLGLSHTALINKVKKHGLKVEINRTIGNKY